MAAGMPVGDAQRLRVVADEPGARLVLRAERPPPALGRLLGRAVLPAAAGSLTELSASGDGLGLRFALGRLRAEISQRWRVDEIARLRVVADADRLGELTIHLQLRAHPPRDGAEVWFTVPELDVDDEALDLVARIGRALGCDAYRVRGDEAAVDVELSTRAAGGYRTDAVHALPMPGAPADYAAVCPSNELDREALGDALARFDPESLARLARWSADWRVVEWKPHVRIELERPGRGGAETGLGRLFRYANAALAFVFQTLVFTMLLGIMLGALVWLAVLGLRALAGDPLISSSYVWGFVLVVAGGLAALVAFGLNDIYRAPQPAYRRVLLDWDQDELAIDDAERGLRRFSLEAIQGIALRRSGLGAAIELVLPGGDEAVMGGRRDARNEPTLRVLAERLSEGFGVELLDELEQR